MFCDRHTWNLFSFCFNSSSDNQLPVSLSKPEQLPAVLNAATKGCLPPVTTPPQTINIVSGGTSLAAKDEPKDNLPVQLAMRLNTVAIEGLTDEELSDSGGEGMYRERDEFVVRNEDIDILKVCTSRNTPHCKWLLFACVSCADICSSVHPGDDERGQWTSGRLESPEGSPAEICARIKRWKEGLLSHQQCKPAVIYIRSFGSWLQLQSLAAGVITTSCWEWGCLHSMSEMKTYCNIAFKLFGFCSVPWIFRWCQGHVPKGICQVPGHS